MHVLGLNVIWDSLCCFSLQACAFCFGQIIVYFKTFKLCPLSPLSWIFNAMIVQSFVLIMLCPLGLFSTNSLNLTGFSLGAFYCSVSKFTDFFLCSLMLSLYIEFSICYILNWKFLKWLLLVSSIFLAETFFDAHFKKWFIYLSSEQKWQCSHESEWEERTLAYLGTLCKWQWRLTRRRR